VVARLIEATRSARGEVHVALAGGSTPRRAYELLGDGLPSWEGVHVWLSDERVVPPKDPGSNHRMVSESLLRGARIDPEKVHRIPVEGGARRAAEAYSAELRSALPRDGEGTPALDVAVLGVGEDGHTASLFPGDPALSPGLDLCVAVERAPKPPPVRVTLTLTALCAAREVVFLVTGANKRPAVEALLSGPDPAVPASLVASRATEVVVDAEAAPEGDLERELAAGRERPGADGLHHVALETRPPGADACRDFFALLGFREIRPPQELVGRARWLERAGQHVHLLLSDQPSVPPAGHLAVVADDYEDVLDALRAAGHEPAQAAEHWGSPRAFVRDPAGHLVEVMAFPPG
jgi:6-phosphogluconolactonase